MGSEVQRSRDLLAMHQRRIGLNLNQVPQGPGSNLDADMVDGLHAQQIIDKAERGRRGGIVLPSGLSMGDIVDHAFEKPYAFLIRKNGSNYEAIYGGGSNQAGKILGTPSTDMAAQIQNALNNLTASRTWKEKISIPCDGTLDVAASLPISVPDYTTLEIDGKITLGNSMNKHMFSSTTMHYITMCGNGILDGNKTQQGSACDIIRFARSGAPDTRCQIFNLTLANARYNAIYLYAGIGNIIQGVTFAANNYDIELNLSEHNTVTGNYSYGAINNVTITNEQDFNITSNVFNYTSGYIFVLHQTAAKWALGNISGNLGNPTHDYAFNVNASVLTYRGPTIRNNYFWNAVTGAIVYPISRKFTNPFHATLPSISAWGTDAAPTANTTYEVWGMDVIISSTNSGNNDNAIIISDNAGNQINPTALSTLDAYHVPVGYKITWGAFTGAAPTVVVCGI